MEEAFEMKDLGQAKMCVGIQIIRDWNNGKISLSQDRYANEILKKFGMENCSSVRMPLDPAVRLERSDGEDLPEEYPYIELIGSLMYLSMCT